MPIDFTADRWTAIRKNYAAWWEGGLTRPLLPVVLTGRDPGRAAPRLAAVNQAVFADLSVPAADIVDSYDYQLSCQTFLEDAFPFISLEISGPGIMAAFLGAELTCNNGHIWFHAREILPPGEMHFTYDADSVWLRRVREIIEASNARWQGQVLIGMPDLGGALDVLSVFRGAENLLMDFYDEPEETKRLIGELYELWHRYYKELNSCLRPMNPGYGNWSGTYSDVPSYIPQCDMSYMIGPAMFEEFAMPELAATFRRLPHTIYHLDGPGQLPHLGILLENPDVDAVQWVPGTGNPPLSEWPEVYRRIHAAGKRIHLYADFDMLDTVAEQIGAYGGIYNTARWFPLSEEKAVRTRLMKYGL